MFCTERCLEWSRLYLYFLIKLASFGSSNEVSGVAKLGHTGVRTLATGGCAPPVQALLKIIGAECTVINRELGAKSAQRC